MAVYSLDLDLDDFDLADLANSLKSLSQDLGRRTLGRVSADGRLMILGEVSHDPDADALIVTPTKDGIQHWGRHVLPNAVEGHPVVLDDARRSMGQLTGGKYHGSQREPFRDIDQAGPDASIWAGATASELHVRFYNHVKIPATQLVVDNVIPKAVTQRRDHIHQHAVHEAYRMNRGEDHLVPVITKAVPSDASPDQRAVAGRALAYEHAALTALARHGLSAAKSELSVDGKGSPVLLVDRFDRESVSILGKTPDGGVEVSSGDLARGPQALGVEALCERIGTTPSPDPFDHIQRLCEKSPALNQAWMARRMFDLFIGNTDHHDGNTAVLWKEENGRSSVSLAPSFDVSPYLMDQVSAIPESGLRGRVLSELSLMDMASRDVNLGRFIKKYPEQAKQAYQRATLVRDEMVSIVSKELPRQGVLSTADAISFMHYLSRPLGGAQPVFEADPRRERESEASMAFGR